MVVVCNTRVIRKILIKLYRSLIWSKLDYACFIYGATRKSHLRTLYHLLPGTPYWFRSLSTSPIEIFIIKGFRTIVFIFIVISSTFRSICPPAFFRCLSNSGTFTELRTASFIESTGVACSDSVCHNRVQVLTIPVLLLACVILSYADSCRKNHNDTTIKDERRLL